MKMCNLNRKINFMFSIAFIASGYLVEQSLASSITTAKHSNAVEDEAAAESSDSFVGFSNSNKYKPWDMDNLSPDDIRCYCNLASCVGTSYMCRTARSQAGGGCFSEIKDSSDKSVKRHGCIELLKAENERFHCDNSPEKHLKKPHKVHLNSLVLCCHENMCNHIDGPPDHHKKLTKANITKELDEELLANGDSFYTDNQFEKQQLTPSHQLPPAVVQQTGDFSSQELWFKVAIIAFPIFGIIILFLLIGMALKLLRNDSNGSAAKLGHCSPGGMMSNMRKLPIDCVEASCGAQTSKQLLARGQGNSKKLLCHNNDLKNENLAKKNHIMTLEYSLLPQSSDPIDKPTNTDPASHNISIYKNNINLRFSPTEEQQLLHHNNKDNKIYEKEILNPMHTPSYWMAAGNTTNTGSNNTTASNLNSNLNNNQGV